MKKVMAVVLVVCMLMSVTALAGVRAVPNQKLAFRTGPNTKYVELYTLPQSTSITAIEYEEGNGVTWVLVEFEKDGRRVRAYTGLKRMSVKGDIPWANHAYSPVIVNTAGQVYAAPGADGAYRGKVNAGETVEFLRYDGDYAYIEFYDGANKADSRGWIPSWMISGEGEESCDAGEESGGVRYYWLDNMLIIENEIGSAPAVPNQELALRTGPNREYNWLGHMPEDTELTAYEYEEGNGVTWVLVEYMKDGLRYRGYTGLKRMTVCGDILWADHLYLTRTAAASGAVLAAPSVDAGLRGNVFYGQELTLLRLEGEYAYVEFYDREAEAYSRGWVYDYMLG